MLSRKTTIRALALILVIALAIPALAGCSARNPNATVLLVGDIKVGITKYYSLYNSYKSLYSAYGIYDVSTAEKLLIFQDNIFSMLVESYLPIYQAKQAGITLTDEEEAKVQSDFQDQLDGYLDGYAEDVDPAVTDEEAIHDEEMTLFKSDLRGNGWTYKEYTEMMIETIRDQAIATKYLDGIYAERVNITDEDVQNHYNELLAQEQEAYASDPVQYYTDYQAYISNGDQQPLVAPEGYRFVKHILIKFAEEGEDKDVDAIVAEVQAKIDAGEDFDELMKEYTEDVDSNGDPNSPGGYLISTETMDKYDEKFAAAAMALTTVGDVTAPVESGYGYHFIQYTSDVSTTPLTLDEAKGAMKENMIADAKSDIYSELIEQWTAETKIVKYYNRVNNIR
jgi:parvulin-like peptidyl-prolyl isomerase